MCQGKMAAELPGQLVESSVSAWLTDAAGGQSLAQGWGLSLINRSITSAINGLWQPRFDPRIEHGRKCCELFTVSLIEASTRVKHLSFLFFLSSYIPFLPF